MKKVLGIGALLSILVLSSCKKDYTCECTSTAGGASSTVTSTIENAKKADAETACNAGDATASAGGAVASVECTLK